MTTERILLKDRLMQETGMEHYEIILDSDREPDAFDSKNLYNSIQKLSVADQKKIQLGMQWLGSFDGFNPVLIGDFAKAFYATEPIELHPIAEYVLDSNYSKLIRNAEKNKFKITLLNSGIEIPDYGCRIYNRDSRPEFEKIVTIAKYHKVFGYAVKISDVM